MLLLSVFCTLCSFTALVWVVLLLTMSVPEKSILGPRKSVRSVVTAKANQKAKSVRSDPSDNRPLPSSVSSQRALPSKARVSDASLKQQGFNAVITSVSAKASRQVAPRVGPSATAQRDPVVVSGSPVPAASFRPHPSTDADTGSDQLFRGSSGAVSASRELSTSSPGQILQSPCEQPSILNPIRFAYQHSDSELGSPPRTSFRVCLV